MEINRKFAARISQVQPSMTMAVVDKAASLRSQGRDIIDFGVGEPDYETPEHVKQAAVEALNQGHTRYTKNVGIDELREAVVSKLERVNNLRYDPSQVIVSGGGKHSLFNVMMTVLDAFDEIIIFAPYWVTFPEMAKLTGAKPVIIGTKEENNFEPDLDEVADKITDKTRAILINSPSNPTGSVFSSQTIQGLVELARENGAYIISDECYDQIVYDKQPVSPAVYEDKPEFVITVQTMSKSYAMTGWRIGYAAAAGEIIQNMAKIQSQSTSHPNSIAQHAAVEALNGDQAFLKEMVTEYRKRRDYVLERLISIPNLSFSKPDGAFYVFPKINDYFGLSAGDQTVDNALDLANFLLDEAGVALVPGDGFGAAEHVRISYSTSMKELERGFDRFEAALQKLK
ncbi:MAG: aminotransferase class I/II-fold pyridoxal phosphate-dependent enzyme [Candidatus Marinimicrobia bacterium]|nr:aminotransferase class I/II-fold pyridoxal phosphate-dependent enzyme [Candidatus Neomarinimicrobiota bacterium]